MRKSLISETQAGCPWLLLKRKVSDESRCFRGMKSSEEGLTRTTVWNGRGSQQTVSKRLIEPYREGEKACVSASSCAILVLGPSPRFFCVLCATWNPLNATTPMSLMGSSLPISPCPAQFAYDNHIEKSQMDWFAPRWLLISLLHLTFMCQVIKRKEHRTGVKGIVCNPRPGSLTSYSVLLSHRMSWSSCLPRVSGMLSRI